MLGLQQSILQEQVQHSTEGRNDRLTWKNRPKRRIAQARDTMKEQLYTANPNIDRRRVHRRTLGLLRVQWSFCEATTCRECPERCDQSVLFRSLALQLRIPELL